MQEVFDDIIEQWSGQKYFVILFIKKNGIFRQGGWMARQACPDTNCTEQTVKNIKQTASFMVECIICK